MYPMEWTLKKECLPIGDIFVYNRHIETKTNKVNKVKNEKIS